MPPRSFRIPYSEWHEVKSRHIAFYVTRDNRTDFMSMKNKYITQCIEIHCTTM